MRSLPDLLSAVHGKSRIQHKQPIARSPSESICIRVRVPRILAAATIRGRRLFEEIQYTLRQNLLYSISQCVAFSTKSWFAFDSFDFLVYACSSVHPLHFNPNFCALLYSFPKFLTLYTCPCKCTSFPNFYTCIRISHIGILPKMALG